jgi:hypothetical protein
LRNTVAKYVSAKMVSGKNLQCSHPIICGHHVFQWRSGICSDQGCECNKIGFQAETWKQINKILCGPMLGLAKTPTSSDGRR